MAITPSFDLVFFGGTGDLTLRKLLPALYQAHKAGVLHPEGRIFALGRRNLELDGYLALLESHVKPNLGSAFDPNVWARSEEHTSELQSLMRISSAVFCLTNKNNYRNLNHQPPQRQ